MTAQPEPVKLSILPTSNRGYTAEHVPISRQATAAREKHRLKDILKTVSYGC